MKASAFFDAKARIGDLEKVLSELWQEACGS